LSTPALLHTREEFSFAANAPFDAAWPLFGADQERVWAPGWDPVFLWPPEKPFDREGMVFKIGFGERTAIWVNTAFDRAARRVQYVYVIPEIMVTVITLKLLPVRDSTTVKVVYERTALAEAANDIVREMAVRDRIAGEEWSGQINRHLGQSLN
jgi:hypothetical protein